MVKTADLGDGDHSVPTPGDALSVVPASPSPATGEDESRDSKKNTPSGFGADWSHCKRSRDPGIPAESSQSTARHKPAATAIAELTAPPQCSGPDLAAELVAKDFVAVSQQIPRDLLKRHRLPQLLRGPLLGRVSRYVEVRHPTPLMHQYQKHVQHLEADRGHGEKSTETNVLAWLTETNVLAWLWRKVRQVCEGGRACRTFSAGFLTTLDSRSRRILSHESQLVKMSGAWRAGRARPQLRRLGRGK
jgi:hypothetical protein